MAAALGRPTKSMLRSKCMAPSLNGSTKLNVYLKYLSNNLFRQTPRVYCRRRFHKLKFRTLLVSIFYRNISLRLSTYDNRAVEGDLSHSGNSFCYPDEYVFIV